MDMDMAGQGRVVHDSAGMGSASGPISGGMGKLHAFQPRNPMRVTPNNPDIHTEMGSEGENAVIWDKLRNRARLAT